MYLRDSGLGAKPACSSAVTMNLCQHISETFFYYIMSTERAFKNWSASLNVEISLWILHSCQTQECGQRNTFPLLCLPFWMTLWSLWRFQSILIVEAPPMDILLTFLLSLQFCWIGKNNPRWQTSPHEQDFGGLLNPPYPPYYILMSYLRYLFLGVLFIYLYSWHRWCASYLRAFDHHGLGKVCPLNMIFVVYGAI